MKNKLNRGILASILGRYLYGPERVEIMFREDTEKIFPHFMDLVRGTKLNRNSFKEALMKLQYGGMDLKGFLGTTPAGEGEYIIHLTRKAYEKAYSIEISRRLEEVFHE